MRLYKGKFSLSCILSIILESMVWKCVPRAVYKSEKSSVVNFEVHTCELARDVMDSVS